MAEKKPGGKAQEELSVRERRKTKQPRLWKVLLHNDDFTTMEFVVLVLVTYFSKSQAEATHVMLQVHRKGVGVAGAYPRDVAETKIKQVTDEAKASGHPLKLTTEPD